MFYVGQLVAITGAQVPAVVVEYDDKDKDQIWAYFPIIVEKAKKKTIEFDIGVEDVVDLSPIIESTDETITGQKIFFGDLCTFKTKGNSKRIENNTKLVESLLKRAMKWNCFTKNDDVAVFKRGK